MIKFNISFKIIQSSVICPMILSLKTNLIKTNHLIGVIEKASSLELRNKHEMTLMLRENVDRRVHAANECFSFSIEMVD